jgi:hypothetical protein
LKPFPGCRTERFYENAHEQPKVPQIAIVLERVALECGLLNVASLPLPSLTPICAYNQKRAHCVAISSDEAKPMLDHPIYVRMPTENDEPHFASPSCAEVVISTLVNAQRLDWLRLHGFVLLPDALEMVCTPLRQGPSGLAAYLQAETIPLLAVLLPTSGMIWARRIAHMMLTTQPALDARLGMLLLAPVATGVALTAESYLYSSANPRYSSFVSTFSGYKPPASDAPSQPNLPAAPQEPIITMLESQVKTPEPTPAITAAPAD